MLRNQKQGIYRVALAMLLAASASLAWAVGTDDSVVSQGGVTVTVGDVDAYMARLPADKWAGFVSNADRIESMLKEILRTKQLAAQAVEMKLDRDASAQAQIAQARADVLARLRMQAFDHSIEVPDLTQLAKEEYLSHKDQYVIPADVTVQQLLISIQGRSQADAKALAEKLHDEAVADPSKFGDLVKQYSDDPSKTTNEGIMQDAASDKYVPEFAKAAAQLTLVAPISPVVKTKYGFHVLKLLKATPAKPQTFDEVKAKILEGLDQQYIADQKKDFLNKLAGQEMTPYPDAIASLHARYFTGTGVPVENPPESAGAKSLQPEPEAKQ